MARPSVGALQLGSSSLADNNFHQQLHLLAPPEVTAACLASPTRAGRNSRHLLSFVTASANLPLGIRIDKDESVLCGRDIVAVTSPLDHSEGGFAHHELQFAANRRKLRRSFAGLAAANTTIDRCSNETGDVASPQEAYWAEEASSSLQRYLLESQWALQARQSSSCQKKVIDSETSSSGNTNARTHSQESASFVVRSGQSSARHRRLMARSNAGVLGDRSVSDSRKSSSIARPSQNLVKKKKGRGKSESVHDFVTSFLKSSSGCAMLGKEEERVFTKQMRICQSLEKAKHELHKRLGYEPSNELWAQSVNMSTEQLLSMVREGEIARDKMMCSHLRLVVSVARAYQNLGVDMADLILEGSKGLLRGLDKFDHRKGHKLCTYVHWWIRQGITRAIADHSRLVRVPCYLHEIMSAIRKGKRLLNDQGRPATIVNLSLVLNIPSYKIERALQAKRKVSSFDKGSSSYGLKMEFDNFHEFVADRTEKNDPWSLFNEENIIGFARDRIALLNSREQDVIRWTFGIDTKGGSHSNMTSIALKLGLSKERVRQLKIRALSKMRQKDGDANFALFDTLDQFQEWPMLHR